jgi:membrane-associated phospholipid phosphatase
VSMVEPGADDPSAQRVEPDAGRRDEARVKTPAWRFALAAAIATVSFWGIYAAFVLTETGQRVENEALLAAALHAASDRAESLADLSTISEWTFAVAVVGVLGMTLVQRRPGLGVLVATVMVGSVVLAELAKDLLPRPELVSGPAWMLRNSFPSGHATVASAIGIGALLASPDRLRWLVMPMGAVYAAVIGQATQVAGWHRLSGAIGGVVLVVAVASLALCVLASMGRVQATDDGRLDRRIRGLLLLVAAASLVVALLVLGLPAVFPILRAPDGAPGAFAHTAFDLVGFGVTILTFVAFAALIEPYTLGRRRSASSTDDEPRDAPGQPGSASSSRITASDPS